MSVVRRFPLHRGFLIRILYETNPFLKKASAEGGVRYREVSVYLTKEARIRIIIRILWVCVGYFCVILA